MICVWNYLLYICSNFCFKVWFILVWFYGISTLTGYSMPNPFPYKWKVLFHKIQLSIGTQYNVKTGPLQTIQFSQSTVSISKTVPFQTIQFSTCTLFSSIWPIDRPYQVLPLRVRMDLGAMAFPKIPALLEPLHKVV